MKKLEIKIPSVGESVNEADIESWEKQTGDTVKKGDILALIETDKASLEIPAEQSGRLTVVKPAGETVTVGDVIGFLEPVKEDSLTNSQNKKSPSKKNASNSSNIENNSLSQKSLSPAVRHLVGEKKLNPETLTGTGKGGRLTKEDILKALNEKNQEPDVSGDFKESEYSTEPDVKEKSPLSFSDREFMEHAQKREKMSALRKTIAERLVHSQQTTATLSTFNEVDMSRIIEMRQKYKDQFMKKHGVKLGFMGFFVQAVVFALKKYPRINAFIEGENIVYNNFCHIGVAISTAGGLVVPVIKKADQMSLADIELQIKFYSEKARKRKLDLQDLSGGTFTISNGGVFGSLLSTPILNPPQSGILGMHKIEDRPRVIEGQVQIRPMMYLTLSYDHRIVDGREGVGFLAKVKEAIEEPARILMDV